MIYIFHGEDFVSSRNAFNKVRDDSSVTLDASDLNKDLLNQLMSESSLFSLHKKLLIENFFNKKSVKNNDVLFEFIKKTDHLDIFIWDDNEITKNKLKDFPRYEDQNFKVQQNIFGFVDNISPASPANVKKFHEALTYSNPEFIFTMIIRQFRLMLGILENSKNNIDEVSRLRDWQISKLKRQCSLFGEEKIKSIYKKLNKIDKSQKTGASKLNLVQSIDMFLLEI